MKETVIKAILFDLGNVVIKLNPSALTRAWIEIGKEKNEEVILNYFLDSDNMNRYMEGRLTSSQFYSKTKRLFRLDVKFHDFYRTWNSIFLPYPEMEEIITGIKAKYPDIKVILLSNTNESHYEYIKKQFKILDIFDDHIVSHEFGAQKPDPYIFTEALKIAGTLPKETFYTDDRLDLIEGARTMGIKAYQFTDHSQLKTQLTKFNFLL